MGQSSSRLQNQSIQQVPSTNSTSSTSVVGVSTELQSDSSVDVGAEPSSRPQSRRSSIRKSILRYVTPSNIRSRINSTTSNPGDVRRSWRNSRRWSKAQPDSVPHHEDSHPGSSSGSSTAGPSTLPTCPLDKGKEREISSPLEGVEEHHAMAPTFDETPGSSYPISLFDSELAPSPLEHISGAPSALNLSNLPSQSVEIMTHENVLAEYSPNLSDPEMSPVSFEGATETPSQQQQPISAPPQQQRPASSPRQFPPPGTLVVVQGIVHTTDVSRPNNSTPSDPATSRDTPPQSGLGLDAADQGVHRTRNRLSALLRPRSSSRPVSTIINDVPSTTIHTHPGGDSLSVSGSESPTSSDESAHTAITTPNINEVTDSSREPLPENPDQSSPAVQNQTTAISSSSIDVLGTLLSVAAAATAASLLTGSSEPILSSGLAPPQTGSPHIPHHTPNASMPNLHSYPGPVPPANVNQDVSAAGRSERMRQAWGTIRERLGLRPSTSATDDVRNQFHQDTSNSNAVFNPPAGDGIGLGSPTDTRELMLAEMARAFNIGLGLNGLGGIAPGSNPVNGGTGPEAVNGSDISDEGSHLPSEDSESASQRQSAAEATSTTLPPEGSFERFLVDLQIDLRAALTQTDNDPDPEQPTPVQEPSVPEPQSIRSIDDITPNSNSAVPLPWTSLGVSPDNSGDHHYLDNPARQNASAVPSDVSESLFYRDGDYVDMPFLQDLTDSESEFDEDEHEDEDYEDEDFQSAEHGSVHDQGRNEPSSAQHGHTSGTGRIDASGRINWWRLYRFPPIVSPPSDASSLRDPSVPTASASTSTTTHAPTSLGPFVPSHPRLPSETILLPFPEITPSQSSTREPPSQSPSQSVVPVIVVGLQSVNSEWRPDLPTQGGDEDVDFFGQPTSDLGVGVENDDDDLDGWGGQHHTGVGAGGHGLNMPARHGRSRGWHSRAANAIRNLRPGRRNAQAGSDVQVPASPPGSRTFLIYVIGGYYPPDHNIVTGGPDILDSFEALLELADLLGQVKPPTVSKDEIEKSGLEIIKASDLPQHEQDGKVSSNCLDRCLICLDDYEPEDPIRVMTCRHAFHQNCVDEWLQKGRNNCPACRSTGVATDSHSTVPVPSSAS